MPDNTNISFKQLARKWLPDYFTILLYIIVIGLFITLVDVTVDYLKFIYLQEFVLQAQGFLQGHWYVYNSQIIAEAKVVDFACFGNHCFWPLGILPAILLTPFVILANLANQFFFQQYLIFPLVILVFFLVFKLAGLLKYSKLDSGYWALAFCGGSVFLSAAYLQWSHYFSHILVVFLLLLSLLEYYGKKRYWLIGGLMGLILLTRATAALIIIFFILEIIVSTATTKEKAINLGQLLGAGAFFLLAFFITNFLRFNNIFEQGYSYANLGKDYLVLREKGLFSLSNIPTNLYYSLLAAPLPVITNNHSYFLRYPFIQSGVFGYGLFFTSPYLIYLFFSRYRITLHKLLLAACLMVYLVLLMFFSVGAHQIGYRYSLDFFPLLFLLVMLIYKNKNGVLSSGMKHLFVLSAIFNWFIFIASYFIYI